MKVYLYQNIEGEKEYSPAKDCKRIFEQEGNKGVKYIVKQEKRETGRKINWQEWHI